MSATKFESLLEAVPDALVGMDQQGVIRFVNHQSESLFGYDRDDLIGRPVEALLPGPLWEVYAEHREQYFADPRTRSSGVDLKLSGRHADGSEFPVNISLSHIDTGDVLLVITAARDVDSRHEAVVAAQLTNAVVKYSNDAIIGSTVQGVITSWNPAAERLYGYTSKEILGRFAGILSPADRAAEIRDNLSRIADGLAVERLETMRVRKDGTVVPVSITVAPIRNEDGEIAGASAVHRDVSEQRAAVELAERMAAIVEGSDDAIFGQTLDGLLPSWNPAAARMFGWSDEEIIGQSMARLVPHDRVTEREAILARVLAGMAVERLETFRLRKDGTRFPVSLTVSPIHDADRVIVGASVIGRDMTAAKEAAETSQTMAAIVQLSGEGIIGTTLDGIITSWNPAAERIYGYSSDEIIGRSGRSMTPDDRLDEALAILEKVKAGEHVENLETVCIRKDGSMFPVSVSVSPIRDAHGVIVGMSAIARDVRPT